MGASTHGAIRLQHDDRVDALRYAPELATGMPFNRWLLGLVLPIAGLNFLALIGHMQQTLNPGTYNWLLGLLGVCFLVSTISAWNIYLSEQRRRARAFSSKKLRG